MSTISAGTTSTTAFKVTSDTTGTLVLQTGAVPTTAISISASQVVTFPATTTLNFTGTLLLGDGSAAAPTLAHAGDTNTGIYFPGADQIAFTTAGTQRLAIDATGVATFASNPILNAGTANGVLYLNASKVATSGSALTFDGANLGVGTASPTAGFRGQFDGDSAAAAISVGVRNTNTTGISRLVLGNNIGQARFTFGYTGSTASAPFGASLGYIGTEGNEPWLFMTNGTERARFTAGGFLGIGTTSPAAPLGVYRAGGGLTGRFASNSGAYVSLFVDAVRDWWISNGISTGTDGVFGIYDATAGITRLVINSSGNVGIGTTSLAANTRLTLSSTDSAKINCQGGTNQNGIVLAAVGGASTFYFGAGSGLMGGDTGVIILDVENNRPVFYVNQTSGELRTSAPTYTTFYTNGSERARITSGGIFSINETSPSSNYVLYSNGAAFTTCGFSSYTANGVFSTNGRPSVVSTPSAATLRFGYLDDGGGQYNPAIGFRAPATLGTGQTDYSNVIWATTNGAIAFGTGTALSYTERARISAGGDLYVGFTSGGSTGASGILKANGLNSKQGLNAALGANVFNFFWTGSAELWVDFTYIGNIAFSSDYRIKKNVVTQTENALARIAKLRPVVYEIGDYGTLFKADGVRREGFIAHEVQEVIPSGAEGRKDEENRIQNLRVDAILAVVVKAIQELKAELDALKGAK